MILQVAPRPQVMQRAMQAKAAQEKARMLAAKEGRILPPEPEMPQDDSNVSDEDDEQDDVATTTTTTTNAG